jgi:hypothetical protein
MGAYSVAGQLHEQGLRARLGRAPRLLVAFAVVAVVAVAGVADLRRRVDALERSYADAIAAMGQATR